MSSPAQCLANSVNAQFSTGPKTFEGKAKVAKNGVSHGLFAKYDNLAPEQSARIAEIVTMAHEGFPQQCDSYEDAIHLYALSKYRYERFIELESSFFSAAMAKEIQNKETAELVEKSGDDVLWGCAINRDASGPNVFAKLLRYEARIAREVDRTTARYAHILQIINMARNKAKPISQPQTTSISQTSQND